GGDALDHRTCPTRRSSDLASIAQVFPTPAQAPKKTFSFPRCGAAVCSSRRSGSGRKGSLFIKFIQRQIEFNNVDNRLADIFHQRDRKSTRLNSSHVSISYA